MEKLQAVLSGIWKWMVSFTVTVAAACLIACAVVLLDLTDEASLEELEHLPAGDIRVGLFVNCAGYGNSCGGCDAITGI